ncbi:MAG: hypothetical protein EBX40_00040 [Gammaproteobacteria bacterium]|nr:hypothetical protein [Gammaproteobacteria bacterium]
MASPALVGADLVLLWEGVARLGQQADMAPALQLYRAPWHAAAWPWLRRLPEGCADRLLGDGGVPLGARLAAACIVQQAEQQRAGGTG